MNRKWTANLRRGNYTPLRVIQTIVVFLLLLLMAGSMISGVILSNYLFKFVKIKGAANTARVVHMLCAYWGFLLLSVHLGIHWNMIVGMAGKAIKEKGKNSVAVKWVLRSVAVGIAGYGVYAFQKRNLAEYLFLRTHFVFFDFGENLVWFLLDYVAVMGMIVFFTYYIVRCLLYKIKT